MVMNITQWRPDTCGCVLYYEWDDQVSIDDRVHSPVAECVHHDGEVGKPHDCGAHGEHRDHHHHYQSVHDENTYKNLVLQHVGHHRVHSWSHNAKRELILVTDHTDDERAAVKAELAQRFPTRALHLR